MTRGEALFGTSKFAEHRRVRLHASGRMSGWFWRNRRKRIDGGDGEILLNLYV
jgi:hypothetical protein